MGHNQFSEETSGRVCPRCKKRVSNNMEFCIYCGTKLSRDNNTFCAKCGKPTSSGALCPQCELIFAQGKSKQVDGRVLLLVVALLIAAGSVVGMLLFSGGQPQQKTTENTVTETKTLLSETQAPSLGATAAAETRGNPTSAPTAAVSPTEKAETTPTSVASVGSTAEIRSNPTDEPSTSPSPIVETKSNSAPPPTENTAAVLSKPPQTHSHRWQEANCVSPKTCSDCGETEGNALGHRWQEANCMSPKTCSDCGETEGNALGHRWQEATCTSPKTCADCGEAEGSALEHRWQEATCTSPKTCADCGEAEGSALEHRWQEATCTSPRTCAYCGMAEGGTIDHTWAEATKNTPKTCVLCGLTEGEPLVRGVFLNELPIARKCGKLWTRSEQAAPVPSHSKKDAPSCWANERIPGHTQGPVQDNAENTYTYGIHVDGNALGPYYLSYDLGGKYTSFTGTFAYPAIVINDVYSPGNSKVVTIKADGKVVFSCEMSSEKDPVSFAVDVTDVQELQIFYPENKWEGGPPNDNPNEIATLFDGRLE